MLSAAASIPTNRNHKLPLAGEGRAVLPFPDPWVLVSALLLLISTILVTFALIMTRRSGAEPV